MIAVTAQTSPIFATKPNQSLLAQAVQIYLARARQASAKVKTRSEVNRTKKKWFKQKGTGNARHGARTAGIFVGGGVAHGPNGQQHYKLNLAAKMKNKALLSALALQSKQTFICDELANLDGKTKSAVKLLADKLSPEKRVLVIVEQVSEPMRRSLANLTMVFTTTASNLSLLALTRADIVICSHQGIKALEKRLLKKATQNKTQKKVKSTQSTTHTDKIAKEEK